MNQTADESTMQAHSAPGRKTYFFVYAALLVLLLATYAAAYANLGVLHTPIALGIAIAKALLIALFFMHIRDSSHLTRLFAAAGFVWLLIMLVITMGDFVARK